MEKKEKYQFSFSTYEAYKKIRKNDPLKMIYESINWSFIDPMIKERYSNGKELVYSPVSLFKAQLLLYLGEAKSNRDLAEKLRFNTKYCVLCGFHQFLKTPAHSTFSTFRKKTGMDLFHKVMQRIIAQSIPIIFHKFPDMISENLHIAIYSKEGKRTGCNCKGKCRFSDDRLKNNKKVRKKNFVASGYKIKLFIDRDSCTPLAAEMRPK